MTAEFTTVLIANRGEIARRVITTAHQRGLRTVAVYSDADADALFVAEADASVRLPGNAPAETYLNVEAILAAAELSGADAIHPGYGFLSENADFARSVIDAGLTWIGPPPEAIETMGSKTRAKELMEKAGVPTLTNLTEDDITEDMLPVLIKASAGGGGRGMRVVRSMDRLSAEFRAASQEALSAFGDGTVFCERYIESGRHIEVQLMADRQGTVWAVGERECSVQRRHQKVIEEAPSPLVEDIAGMRERLFDAARAAADAIGYEGAGTVEFLADAKGDFFFLEVNTRLQVEHPVTEATTGLDLVALQLSVAAGHPLPSPEPPEALGWSVEARLYAEDPSNEYRPMSGNLTALEFDDVVAEFQGPGFPGIRLDTGVDPSPGAPAHVGVHYDAMLAKVISWGQTRDEAVARLAASLRRARIHGLDTNRALLVRILEDSEFRSGDFDTGFLSGDRFDALTEPLLDASATSLSTIAAAAALDEVDARSGPLSNFPLGFRNVGASSSERRFLLGEDEITVALRRSRTATVAADDPEVRIESVDVVSTADGAAKATVRINRAGLNRVFRVQLHADGSLGVDSGLGPLSLTVLPRFEDPADAVAEGSLLAPMPGSVTAVHVAVGDTVAKGDILLSLEAMKMEHGIRAGADGEVTELTVSVGDQVDSGKVLAVVESGD